MRPDGAGYRSSWLPYNLQVDLINELLPDGVSPAPSTSFQGQEADIFIFLIDGFERRPGLRGLEFLFSGNRFNIAVAAAARGPLRRRQSCFTADCQTVDEMRLANRFCAFVACQTNVVRVGGAMRFVLHFYWGGTV